MNASAKICKPKEDEKSYKCPPYHIKPNISVKDLLILGKRFRGGDNEP